MNTRKWMRLAGLIVVVLALQVQAETVVITNARNTDISLSSEQVLKIFMGRVTRFPNGAMAQPIDQPDGPVRDLFYHSLTGKSAAQIKTYWSRQMFTGLGQPPQQAASAEEVLKLVGQDPTLIGYVERESVKGDKVIVLLSMGGGEEDSIAVYK